MIDDSFSSTPATHPSFSPPLGPQNDLVVTPNNDGLEGSQLNEKAKQQLSVFLDQIQSRYDLQPNDIRKNIIDDDVFKSIPVGTVGHEMYKRGFANHDHSRGIQPWVSIHNQIEAGQECPAPWSTSTPVLKSTSTSSNSNQPPTTSNEAFTSSALGRGTPVPSSEKKTNPDSTSQHPKEVEVDTGITRTSALNLWMALQKLVISSQTPLPDSQAQVFQPSSDLPMSQPGPPPPPPTQASQPPQRTGLPPPPPPPPQRAGPSPPTPMTSTKIDYYDLTVAHNLEWFKPKHSNAHWKRGFTCMRYPETNELHIFMGEPLRLALGIPTNDSGDALDAKNVFCYVWNGAAQGDPERRQTRIRFLERMEVCFQEWIRQFKKDFENNDDVTEDEIVYYRVLEMILLLRQKVTITDVEYPTFKWEGIMYRLRHNKKTNYVLIHGEGGMSEYFCLSRSTMCVNPAEGGKQKSVKEIFRSLTIEEEKKVEEVEGEWDVGVEREDGEKKTAMVQAFTEFCDSWVKTQTHA